MKRQEARSGTELRARGGNQGDGVYLLDSADDLRQEHSLNGAVTSPMTPFKSRKAKCRGAILPR